MGNIACMNMARYFPKAVATHLNQLYSNPEFKNFAEFSTGATRIKETLTSKLEELSYALKIGLISENEYNNKRSEILSDY
jgi:hypothetical protein